MRGAMTPVEAFTATFELVGKSPGDVHWLVDRDRELLRQHATVHPDAVRFIDEAAARGVALALVSNCAPNTGPLLESVGLAARVDHVVLSCDVGATKPDAAICRAALEALDVHAAEALFVDD